jgi:hypothetical protein
MRPHTSQQLPELEIRGDDIAFVFPETGKRPNDRLWCDPLGPLSARWRELLSAIAAVFILGALGAGFLTFAVLVPEGRASNERGALLGLGGAFLLLAPLSALWALHRFRHYEWYLQKARDQRPTELGVESRCLVRRYASGRTQVWPREQIENVLVERRGEVTSSGENDHVILVGYLRLILRAGGTVDLYGPAAPDSVLEDHLHGMAGELRRALQVPYDAPPTPLAGASVERSASGVTIRLPSADPEAVWRDGVRTHLWGAALVAGFLGICWAIFHSRAIFFEEVGSKPWQDSLFMLVCIPITATIFCSIALARYLNKSQGVQAIADRTPVALAVRAGALYRCYQSGREECWLGGDIAAVRVDRVNKCDQVRLHLKGGATVHLFGNVAANEPNKLLREGLTWLALQLGLGLGPPLANPLDGPT